MTNEPIGGDKASLAEPVTIEPVATASPGHGAGGDLTGLSVETTATLIDLRGIEAKARRGLLRARRWQLFVKRAMDVAGSLFLLTLFVPILAVTAVAVAVTSGSPVFYVHERVGRDGRHFSMLKFRSMRAGAHEERDNVIHLNEMGGPVFKVRNDPRITPVGRVIRKLSLDELPQLWNVLRGDMSLVGPRPPLPEEFATYGERARRRMEVTPGITCIWQVSGRSTLDFEKWLDLDLEYIERWTLREDLKLLLRTIPAVISGRGAY